MTARKKRYQAFCSIVVTVLILMGGFIIPWEIPRISRETEPEMDESDSEGAEEGRDKNTQDPEIGGGE